MLDERRQILAESHLSEDYLRRIVNTGIERAAALVIAPLGDFELTRTLNDAVGDLTRRHDGFFFAVCSVHPDDDSGNSPLSIIEIPHLRAAVGCCRHYLVWGRCTAFLVASERARWLRIR